MKRLASVAELNSAPFKAFISWINGFARVHGLRVHETWSKIWEYPWVWRQIQEIPLSGARILDLGSEISPMPWFFASLGSNVQIVETDPAFVSRWKALRDGHGFDVRWALVSGTELPLCDGQFDLVTSYSVIEHMAQKESAINEAARVLKPGGLLCLTFDLCEPALGMSFPAWNGVALDMETFDRAIWSHPELEPVFPEARWNVEDIDAFLLWHRKTAPHHNYAVGGAVLRKRGGGSASGTFRKTSRKIRVHQIDTGLGSGNTGDDAMFLAAHAQLPEGIALSTEVHSLDRIGSWPSGVDYIDVHDGESVGHSIAESAFAILLGDTPIMDAWGLEWPLRSNARKLGLCHQLGRPVHCVGVGVDRLENPEALDIFREFYLPVSSWSVRSAQCKQALMEMEVPDDRIVIGADFAWLLPFRIDMDWAMARLCQSGYDPDRVHIGINLVNEIWRDDTNPKRIWAQLLDDIAGRFDAQIVFLCNESRRGDYYDVAAAESVRAQMRRPSIMVADRYFTPAEMVSLLSPMDITISERYHFTLFSVLVDVYPVSIQRGQKMKALNDELGLPLVGDMKSPNSEAIVAEIDGALRKREEKMSPLRRQREVLAARALRNFSMIPLRAGS